LNSVGLRRGSSRGSGLRGKRGSSDLSPARTGNSFPRRTRKICAVRPFFFTKYLTVTGSFVTIDLYSGQHASQDHSFRTFTIEFFLEQVRRIFVSPQPCCRK
jgi:hypothetical protein